jgi:hypothetical protein
MDSYLLDCFWFPGWRNSKKTAIVCPLGGRLRDVTVAT